MVSVCGTPVVGRRRSFWTLQPCRIVKDECGNDCSEWGLELLSPNSDNLEPHEPGDQRTINTENWIRSIVISILGTDARKPHTPCGYRPGSIAGHWSDSYRNTRYPGRAGTNIRDLKSHGRVGDAIKELKAYLQNDMQKLVTYGVAASVEVEVSYKGANTALVNIIVYGQGGNQDARIGFSVSRIANAWVWDT